MTAGVVLQGIIEVRTDGGKTHIAQAMMLLSNW